MAAQPGLQPAIALPYFPEGINLAEPYRAQGRYEAAEPLHKRTFYAAVAN